VVSREKGDKVSKPQATCKFQAPNVQLKDIEPRPVYLG